MAIQIAHYEYLFCPTVNKLSHVCQDSIFRGDNVTLDIPGGNSIRREENLSANKVYTTDFVCELCIFIECGRG